MKILLVNANMTESVTNHVVTVARAHASAGTDIDGVTGRFGANIVTAEPENVIAAHAALDLLAMHYADYDAAILAISFDSGLEAARDLVPIPVLGMTDAALRAARSGSDRIGIVMFGSVSRPLYEAVFARSPVHDAIRAIEVVEIASVAAYLETDRLEEQILEAIKRMEQGSRVKDVVICGAAMAGIAPRLQARCAPRLHDGIIAATHEAEALFKGTIPITKERDPLVRSSRVTGVSPALEALFRFRNAQS